MAKSIFTAAAAANTRRTLHITELSEKCCIAIDQRKREIGTTANTRAATSLIEDYYTVQEDRDTLRDQCADLQRQLDTIRQAYQLVNQHI